MWLIIDGNYLAHRTFHSIKGLNHNDVPTGVVYGFLKSIDYLQSMFSTKQIAFCFDHINGLREAALPEYKWTRRNKQYLTEGDRLANEELRRQISLLKTKYLKEIGYSNVFYEEGYEADDLIASIIHHSIPYGIEAVIVSADGDMLQLLSGSVRLYNPTTRSMNTIQSLYKEYGVGPEQWAMVKAISGCKTDDLSGIKGVKEKTACKYILGALKETTKSYQNIKAGKELIERNLPFVTLPYNGTPRYTLTEDKLTKEGWDSVCQQVGINSLRAPINQTAEQVTGARYKRTELGAF